MSWWAGLDPGRCKCGLVLVDLERNFVREGRTVPPDAVHGVIHDWHRTFRLNGIVVGDGTTSRRWLQELSNLAPVHEVVERGSTLQARQRYWELWPPRGWRRLVPIGLQTPPSELDSLAALVLVERHLENKFSWSDEPR